MNELQPAHQSFRNAEKRRVAIVQATGEERLDFLLASSDSDRAACRSCRRAGIAASTDRSDMSRQRQLAVDDDTEVTHGLCAGLGDTMTKCGHG